MLEKAKNSFTSAKILKDAGEANFCMSAQCAYYSGLQFAMGLLMTIKNLDADQLYEWYQHEKDQAESGRWNSHAFYIRQFKEAVSKITGDKRIAHNINQTLLDLKILREKAAYKAHLVDEKAIELAIKNAESLHDKVPGYIR